MSGNNHPRLFPEGVQVKQVNFLSHFQQQQRLPVENGSTSVCCVTSA
jgi:hypothetical protein